MERQLWSAIVALLRPLDKTPLRSRHDYSDACILGIFFWACLHDRPISWACVCHHWPIELRTRPRPSPATMSRRLRHPSVAALLLAVQARVLPPAEPGLFWMIDGKPLPVSGVTGDAEATCGRAARGLARGYKLHAIMNAQGEIAAFEVAPMNVDERVVAARLLPAATIQGYLVADANYDSNVLHAICDRLGDRQLVTPRRYAKTAKGTGHRPQTRGRRRLLAGWSAPEPRYVEALLKERRAIERGFANLTNWGGGLGPLPSWVRTLARVTRWVTAKLILTALKRPRNISTYGV